MDFDYNNNGYTPQPSNSSSLLESLGSINVITWIIIIMLMTFLGFNVFVYLAEGTQNITEMLASVIKKIFGVTIAVTGNTIDMTAEGAKTVVNTTAQTLDAGLTAIQDITPNSSTVLKGASSTQQTAPDIMQQSGLNNALNHATSQQQHQSSDYEAEESHSSLKSGWCYIGEDRGYRSCAQVGPNDECMSGDIFPTHDVCVNPKLRA